MASTPEKKNTTPELKDAIDGSITVRLSKLQEELKKNPKNPEGSKIRGEIAELRRELNRTKQYTNITKENSKKLIESKNMDTLSAAELMKIDREEGSRGEFLSKSFLYKRTTDAEGNISEEPTNGKDLKEGDTLFVDFGKNRNANDRIGLGHMLPIDIGYVKVGDRIGVRTIINGRVGYYTNPTPSGYIPVFTGDTVSIPSATEVSNFEKQKDANLQRNSNQEENNKANDLYIENLTRVPAHRGIELNVVTKESYEFWKSKGFNHDQACGIVANEYRESSGNTKATNTIAVGIFQWEGTRKENIESKYGKSILEMSHLEQLEVAWGEMNTTEAKTLESIKMSTSPREAGAIFSQKFERPKDEQGEMNVRGELAEIFSNQIEGRGVSPITILGANREEIESSLIETSFLGNTVKIHKAIIPALKNAETEILNNPSLSSYKVYRTDGYVWRNMRGKGALSNHALGIALDINPEENMGDFGNGKADIPQGFVDIMKKNGFVWGGDWKTPYDPMHFEFSKSELLSQALTKL